MKKINEQNAKEIIYIMPLILLIAVVPLILRFRVIILEGEWFECWTGAYIENDYFSYYKSLFIITLSVVGTILLLLRVVFDRFHLVWDSALIWVVLVGLTMIVSSLLSDYSFISLHGYVHHGEGILVLISYLIMFVLAYQQVTSEKAIKIIIGSLLISAFMICLLGFFQFFGKDYLNTWIGRRLIYPFQYHYIADSKTIVNVGKEIIATMGNSNYVGSYMAMVFPLATALYFGIKSRLKTGLFSVLLLLFFAVWIGCKSRAGMLGGMIALLIIILFMRKQICRDKFKIFIIIPMICIALMMNTFSDGSLFGKIKSFNPDIEKTSDDRLMVKSFELNDNFGKIKTNHYTIAFSVNKGYVHFYNDNNVQYAKEHINEDSYLIHIDDTETLKVQEIVSSKKTILITTLDNIKLNWYIKEDVIQLGGKLGEFHTSVYEPEKWGFEGRETFASGRGYIWSRSFPLIKNNLWLGTGPDTFGMYFPQEDFVGKANYFRTLSMVVDKPHSYYLQLLINTGLISLITMLILFLSYILKTFMQLYTCNFTQRCQSNMNDFYAYVVGIFAAVIGYLIAAIFNDSVVSVAPIFWILLGIGFASHRLMKCKCL